MKKIIIFLIFLFCLPFFQVRAEEPALVQEETLEGKVIESLEEDVVTQAGQQYLYQKLKVLITKGSLEGKEVTIEVGNIPLVGQPKYQAGDQVLITHTQDYEGKEFFYITDFVRRTPLVILFLIFVTLTVLVGRWRGLSSLLGLGVSFSIIFLFILPQIDAGQDPILIAVLASLMIIPATFYLSHGFNQKTTMAVLGTLIALLITGFLAKTFVGTAKLTGYASEEAGFLQVARPGLINIRDLILAGIIIGVLGILDDITISQAAIVQQLKKANSKIKPKKLFSQAMEVGQDHIASMVNTLVLVYTGAALPLLLLFVNNPRPFTEVINYEIIAEEVIRTLVGSIGLITAVPITTFLAALWYSKKRKR